jgi:succinate-semialdehyde dehydrogenase/glutarate-semialdehyde dehydrogenase
MTPSFGMDDEGYAKLMGKSLGMLKALRFK